MIVVDVETTGLHFGKHSIVSIGAVDFRNPENQFYEECRIWKGAEVNDIALEINGFTREQITDPNKKSLQQIIEEFLSWSLSIKDRTLAGENPNFDRDFLKFSFYKYGMNFPFGRRTVDLHSVSYAAQLSSGLIVLNNNSSGLSADMTYTWVGLPEEPKPHNALTGAKMEAEAFSRLIHRKNLLPEYAGCELPYHLKNKK